MNKLIITRENGGIGRVAANEDPVSGLLFYVPSAAYTLLSAVTGGAFVSSRIAKFAYLEEAVAAGISNSSTNWYIKMMYYQIREAYRMNNSLPLYVGVYDSGAVDESYDEIATMQRYAKGKIRQIGVWNGSEALAAADIPLLQTQATAMETAFMPLSIVYFAKSTKASLLALDLHAAGRRNLSVVIGADGDNGLFAVGNTDSAAVGVLGLIIGIISSASVHESIGWVGKFPAGIANPALCDGTLMSTLTTSEIETLDANGYLFLVTYPAYTGSFMNDSHTLDADGSDYMYIERERAMDKAVRGVYANLLPYLGAPVYINTDGTLRGDSVANLTNVGNQALEDMETAGELSGYEVSIDATQNVSTSSEISIVIRQIAVGVSRTLRVKIGYVTSLEG